MLISEYSWAVAKAAARAFFLWLLALLGTEVVMGMGVCTMLMGEFSGRLSSCREFGDKATHSETRQDSCGWLQKAGRCCSYQVLGQFGLCVCLGGSRLRFGALGGTCSSQIWELVFILAGVRRRTMSV